MINEKKGQIATTATWMAASAIVFFMLVLFILVVSSMTAIKRAPIVSSYSETGKNSVNIVGLEMMSEGSGVSKELYSVLNKKVEGEGARLYDVILQYALTDDGKYRDIIEKGARGNLDALGECYYLCINIYEDGKLKSEKDIRGDKCTNILYLTDQAVGLYCEDIKNSQLYESARLVKVIDGNGKNVKVDITLHEMIKERNG